MHVSVVIFLENFLPISTWNKDASWSISELKCYINEQYLPATVWLVVSDHFDLLG